MEIKRTQDSASFDLILKSGGQGASFDLILKSGGQGCFSRMGTIFFKHQNETWDSMVQQTEDMGDGIGYTWVPALALALFFGDIGQVA